MSIYTAIGFNGTLLSHAALTLSKIPAFQDKISQTLKQFGDKDLRSCSTQNDQMDFYVFVRNKVVFAAFVEK